MPFDGKRMFWGGFEQLVTEGSDRGGSYYQGFLTPVPQENKDAFHKLAREAWNDMFKPYGAMGNHESWGVDVPHGTLTDMYRAVDAKDGEVIVMSWTTWPDRATCDEAARKKPAPDVFLLALERLGVAAEDAVAFEDSAAGIRSALFSVPVAAVCASVALVRASRSPRVTSTSASASPRARPIMASSPRGASS